MDTLQGKKQKQTERKKKKRKEKEERTFNASSPAEAGKNWGYKAVERRKIIEAKSKKSSICTYLKY